MFIADERRSNMHAGVLDEDRLFAYIYAVLHSEVYRKRYADFLMMDYPRVPIANDAHTFEKLSNLGSGLLDVHLLRAPLPESEAAINARIGGYDIPRKFIDDRKHRPLTPDETHRLAQIRAALAKTAELRKQIDAIVSESSLFVSATHACGGNDK